MYQRRLRAANALDFDDLIMTAVHLFQAFPEVRETYRRRFRHVLVDEYQDTNHAQYALVRELCGTASGARPRSAATTPTCRTTPTARRSRPRRADGGRRRRPVDLRLPRREHPQHPRSSRRTSPTRARSCSSRTTAPRRTSSTPPTRSSAATRAARPRGCGPTPATGEPIVGYVADDEHDEARFVSDEIDKLTDEGVAKPRDVAVFYRTNAQSRVFEEVFIRVGMPYKVVGGVRFYERKEVRDALAYLRMLANPADEISLRRVLNVPKRGIGERAEACVEALARRDGITFWEALRRADEAPGIATRSVTAIRGFVDVVERAAGDGRGRRARRRRARAGARPHRLPRRARGQRRPAGRDPGGEPRRARRGRPRVRRRAVPPPSADPADLDPGAAGRARVPRAGQPGRRLRPDPRPGRRGRRASSR